MTKEQPAHAFADLGYTEIGIKQDLAGLDRVAFGRYTGKKRGHKNVRPFGGNRNEI